MAEDADDWREDEGEDICRLGLVELEARRYRLGRARRIERVRVGVDILGARKNGMIVVGDR